MCKQYRPVHGAKVLQHSRYATPHKAVRCRGLLTPRYNEGRLYPIRCGCSHSFDEWPLLVFSLELLY